MAVSMQMEGMNSVPLTDQIVCQEEWNAQARFQHPIRPSLHSFNHKEDPLNQVARHRRVLEICAIREK